MTHVAVTLEFNNTSKDLALPLDVTVRLLIEGLTESLHLKKGRGQSYTLSVKGDHGLRPIPANATLADASILHGMILMLLLEDLKVEESWPKTGGYLQAKSGQTFPVANKLTVIGRNDPKSGIFVDVDLKGLVTDPKIISRRHAQIERDGERFYLTDLGSNNGTTLNGVQIPKKEKQPLWNGDLVEFGRHGAKLTFITGEKE